MKVYLWLPLACLIGYLVGSWGAQDELRSFRSHARDVKQNAAARVTAIPIIPFTFILPSG